MVGDGLFAGDVRSQHPLHLVLVRSPRAHGRILSVDADEARAMAGVAAVWIAADLPPSCRTMTDWLPPDLADHPRPVLAEGVVQCEGDAVAVVLAEGEYLAHDAAQLVRIEIEPLPVLPGQGTVEQFWRAGAAATAPQPARQQVYAFGDIEAAFADAPVIVKEVLSARRICGAAMEPRAAHAQRVGDRLIVHASTQSVFNVRKEIALRLGLEPSQIHVLAPDVGGGFGPKGTVYPEDVLVALAAWTTGRPARWVGGRSEDTLTTVHAHGTEMEFELAADAQGHILGIRGRIMHDAGAYGTAGANQPNNYVSHLISTYTVPALRVEAEVFYTNSAPTGFVRGGGRPLGNFGMERMMDRLARRLAMDPVELRRRNLVAPAAMPHPTGLAIAGRELVYDSGDYGALMAAATRAIDYDRRRASHPEQANPARLLGLGVACCVEQTGTGNGERARIQLGSDGVAHLYLGCTPQGQGHETMGAIILAQRLGWDQDRVVVHAGDSEAVASGGLTAGSRTALHAGNAIALAALSARRRLLERAAAVLEVEVSDLNLAAGVVTLQTDPLVSIPAADLLAGEGLEVEESWEAENPTAYSSACHAALVEVDTGTGSVAVLDYAIAYDVGQVINPITADGQLHGGWCHGLGMALLEEAVYDSEGSFKSASFLDYQIPTALESNSRLQLISLSRPTPSNTEGIKGVGENGTIPVPACIANAVEDALRAVNPQARINSIPITPELVLSQIGTR